MRYFPIVIVYFPIYDNHVPDHNVSADVGFRVASTSSSLNFVEHRIVCQPTGS